jgi:hypothetical protein
MVHSNRSSGSSATSSLGSLGSLIDEEKWVEDDKIDQMLENDPHAFPFSQIMELTPAQHKRLLLSLSRHKVRQNHFISKELSIMEQINMLKRANKMKKLREEVQERSKRRQHAIEKSLRVVMMKQLMAEEKNSS